MVGHSVERREFGQPQRVQLREGPDQPAGIDGRIGLRDEIFVPFDGRKELDLIRHTPLHDFPVRRLDKAELIDPGIRRQRRNQSDVRTFRGFDRTNTTIVSRVHVADFKTGTLTS